jgi:hypothetical protein
VTQKVNEPFNFILRAPAVALVVYKLQQDPAK